MGVRGPADGVDQDEQRRLLSAASRESRMAPVVEAAIRWYDAGLGSREDAESEAALMNALYAYLSTPEGERIEDVR